jgi:hypothetical protein
LLVLHSEKSLRQRLEPRTILLLPEWEHCPTDPTRRGVLCLSYSPPSLRGGFRLAVKTG